MSRYKYIITLIVVCFLSISGFSQQKKQIDNNFLISADSLFDKIYNYAFTDAEQIFLEICNSYNNSLALSNLKASYYWYLLVSGNTSTDYYQMCHNELLYAKDKYVKKQPEITDPFILGNTIFLYAALARLEIFEKNYMKALQYLDKCSKYIKRSFAEDDERFVFSTGLYHYYIAFSLRKYPFLFPIIALYPKGDKNLGLKLLKQGCNSSQLLVRTESRYFLMKIYFESEKDIKYSKVWLDQLLKEFPDNLLFNYYYFKILIKENKISQANTFLNRMRDKAYNNSQLNLSQKNHFISIAREELN